MKNYEIKELLSYFDLLNKGINRAGVLYNRWDKSKKKQIKQKSNKLLENVKNGKDPSSRQLKMIKRIIKWFKKTKNNRNLAFRKLKELSKEKVFEEVIEVCGLCRDISYGTLKDLKNNLEDQVEYLEEGKWEKFIKAVNKEKLIIFKLLESIKECPGVFEKGLTLAEMKVKEIRDELQTKNKKVELNSSEIKDSINIIDFLKTIGNPFSTYKEYLKNREVIATTDYGDEIYDIPNPFSLFRVIFSPFLIALALGKDLKLLASTLPAIIINKDAVNELEKDLKGYEALAEA